MSTNAPRSGTAQEQEWAHSHDWIESYYGYDCKICGLFIPYGSEPWMPFDPTDCPESYLYCYGDEGGDE